MSRNPRVLVVEDDPDGCRSVTEAIEDLDIDVVATLSGEEGVRAFLADRFDVVLSDLALPDMDGIEVMNRIHIKDENVPILIMTAYGSVSSAVNAMRNGAYDYITKPLDLGELQTRIGRAVEVGRLRAEVKNLHDAVKDKHGIESMVADSPNMQELTRQIIALADTTATVLVQGESGTGKELVARALHAEGRRAHAPFVAVNCGAFTESLLESALFGHEKGAFTGAIDLRKGAFERADGGTLFLDEVGTAPAPVQVKLLRVLEERELLRVGGQTSVAVDVRVVSASNQDLMELVEAGDFREDLLYRLNVVLLELPPLRERRDDIRKMVDRFVRAASQEHGRAVAAIEPACYDLLMAQEWPGNVRQLKNVIESSVVMMRDTRLKVSDLRLNQGARKNDPGGFVAPEGMTLEEMEKEILVQMLTRHGGNRTLVSDKLGLSRRTIQRKIKEFELPF
ncbi:MAG: sigma-54 dependent transcriptional regulator [Verrucomicrobia bacterium]|nr:sigma-54 dependent transcriptional regulator [Verrucomicrobiota bacterium]